jgi:hypothetical protein
MSQSIAEAKKECQHKNSCQAEIFAFVVFAVKIPLPSILRLNPRAYTWRSWQKKLRPKAE